MAVARIRAALAPDMRIPATKISAHYQMTFQPLNKSANILTPMRPDMGTVYAYCLPIKNLII